MSPISQTGSTRHILGLPASPPPFSSFLNTSSFLSNGSGKKDRPTSPAGSTHSHTLNYLPSSSKFTRVMVSRRRNFEKDPALGGMVPRGGGVVQTQHAWPQKGTRTTTASASDTRSSRPSAPSHSASSAARFKPILFLANLVLSLYALVLLVFVILTYLCTLPPPPSSSSRTKQK